MLPWLNDVISQTVCSIDLFTLVLQSWYEIKKANRMKTLKKTWKLRSTKQSSVYESYFQINNKNQSHVDDCSKWKQIQHLKLGKEKRNLTKNISCKLFGQFPAKYDHRQTLFLAWNKYCCSWISLHSGKKLWFLRENGCTHRVWWVKTSL